MSYREDYVFWFFIHSLTVHHHYQIISVLQDHSEVWLESETDNRFPIVRFMRADLAWSNWLKRDIERTLMNGENTRSRLYKKPINILSIYISKFLPVDEHEDLLQNPVSIRKTTVTSLVIDSEHRQERIRDLSVLLEIPLSVKDTEYDLLENEIIDLKQSVLSNAYQKRKEEQKVFEYGKPRFTMFFLFLQIVVFGLTELYGSSESTKTLVEFGAKFTPLILAGEWWRFITPIFLHIGFFHLMMNSFALYYIGSEVEKIYGSVRFLLIYLFAGFAGTLGSFLFTPSISYLKAIQQKESFHQAHYNVALVYLEEKNMEKAKYHAGRAHELKPSEPIYKKLKTQLDKLIVTGQEG